MIPRFGFKAVSCLSVAAVLAAPLWAERKKKPLTAKEISSRAAPAVVAIEKYGEDRKLTAKGSGFLVSADGRIVTNYHMIRDARYLGVRLNDGDVYDSVDVVDTDIRRDLAIIKIKGAKLPTVPLGDSDTIEVGQTIFSIGNPEGLQNTLQQGLVSAVRQTNGYRLVQVAVSLNPGNSGGPVLNDQGEVIAVASAQVRGAENLGFAIPINYVSGLLQSAKGAVPLALFYEANKTKTPSPAADPSAGNEKAAFSGPARVVETKAEPTQDVASNALRDLIVAKIGSWTEADARQALGNPIQENSYTNPETKQVRGRGLTFAAPGTAWARVLLYFPASSSTLASAIFYPSSPLLWDRQLSQVKSLPGGDEYKTIPDGVNTRYDFPKRKMQFVVRPDGTVDYAIYHR